MCHGEEGEREGELLCVRVCVSEPASERGDRHLPASMVAVSCFTVVSININIRIEARTPLVVTPVTIRSETKGVTKFREKVATRHESIRNAQDHSDVGLCSRFKFAVQAPHSTVSVVNPIMLKYCFST